MKEIDRFRLLFEHSGESIFIIDPASETIIDANPFACRMLRYSIEELRGRPVSLVHPNEMPHFRQFACEIVDHGHGRTESLHCTTKDGSTIPVEIFASYFVEMSGRSCMIAIARDLSKQLATQKEIEDLSRFPSENPFPILRIAAEGLILYANRPGSSILERLPARAAGLAPADWCDAAGRALTTGAAQEIEVSEGGRIYAFFFWPIVPAGYVNVYGQDITERKKADAMKNSFIAMVSHEMNTPLACIAGALSMLSDSRLGADSESQKKFLALAQRNHERLVRLCSDTIDVSQILAGTFSVEVRDADLTGAVRSACGAVTYLAHLKGIEVAMTLPESPVLIKIDWRRIEQAVMNIVRNAIEAASAHVEIRLQNRDSGWQIVVDDDGPGFASDEMPHLFDIFFMGARKQKSGGGVGLGLPIAKTMVELHGGTISLENRPAEPAPGRKGARVTILLPEKNTGNG